MSEAVEKKCRPTVRVDWPEFLARHDLVWTQPPRDEYEGAWLGNGMVGSVLRVEENELRLQVFRADVEDHRREPCADLDLKAGQTALFCRPGEVSVVEAMTSNPERRNWYGLNKTRRDQSGSK